MKSFGDLSKFQLIFLGVFAAFIVIGVIIFATGGIGRGVPPEDISRATVWGTINESHFRELLNRSGLADDETIQVTYVQRREATFDQDLLNALADGRGPDIIILPDHKILDQERRIFKIPYEWFSVREFQDTFLPIGETYLTPDGIIGLPFTVDPLVMYWNRDIFTGSAILEPPRQWVEFHNLAQTLTQRAGGTGIERSAVALGEIRNINHGREILSALIIQAGNPITLRRERRVEAVLNQRFDRDVAPAVSALTFFTDFSNPAKPSYSWTRSLPQSREFFTNGDLAVYFGFASEYSQIQETNPNLNFDVAMLPQTSGTPFPSTYGRTESLAILSAASNKAASFRVARALTGRQSIEVLSQITGLPPVRRDLAALPPSTAFDPVFYQSAIQARTWVGPGPDISNSIFMNMVEAVTGGRETVGGAVQRAQSELSLELRAFR